MSDIENLIAPPAPGEVEGLTRWRIDHNGAHKDPTGIWLMEQDAATALTALQAEIERLREREAFLSKMAEEARRERDVQQARAEKAEAELAKIVEGIADDATAIPEACGKLHDLLCLPDGAKPSTDYDWAREAYDLLIPVSGRAIDRAAHAKLILARLDQRKEARE